MCAEEDKEAKQAFDKHAEKVNVFLVRALRSEGNMNKDLMRKAGFGKEVDRIEAGRCPFCEKKIDLQTEFKDKRSRREFEISGLCQACQDEIFKC